MYVNSKRRAQFLRQEVKVRQDTVITDEGYNADHLREARRGIEAKVNIPRRSKRNALFDLRVDSSAGPFIARVQRRDGRAPPKNPERSQRRSRNILGFADIYTIVPHGTSQY